MADPECPNCVDLPIRPSIAFDPNRGDSTCTGCGEILRVRLIDEGSEWRNFADGDKDRSRVGNADPYFTGQLSTHLSAGNSKASQAMALLHNRTTFDGTTRNLMEASANITSYSDKLNLTSHVSSKAKEIYREYETKRAKTMRTGKCPALILAILYRACKQEGVGRTFKELSKSTGVAEKEIRKYASALDKLLPSYHVPALSADSLVERFVSKMMVNFPEWVKIGAINIANKATPKVEGKQPSSIAAASILMASKIAGIFCTEDQIADASTSISAATVKNVYTQLTRYQSEIVSDEFLNKARQYRASNASSSAQATSSSMNPASSVPSTSSTSAATMNNAAHTQKPTFPSSVANQSKPTVPTANNLQKPQIPTTNMPTKPTLMNGNLTSTSPFSSQSQSIPTKSIPNNSVPNNSIPNNSIPNNSIPNNSIPNNSIQSHQIKLPPTSNTVSSVNPIASATPTTGAPINVLSSQP